MIKEVPIGGSGFQAVLKEIVPLARSLRCSYRGTEIIGGFEQFVLTRPLPERYAAHSSSAAGTFAASSAARMCRQTNEQIRPEQGAWSEWVKISSAAG
jgi:hypothetical protein